ncbi:MAG: hypothetical protein KC731_12840 [Myxococcales bacterium]|nr:hypothetical protein [Myxococcales bacterium]
MSSSASDKSKSKAKKDADDKEEAPKKAAEKATAKKAAPALEDLEPMLESDAHETRMTFGDGGFPWYVKLIWATFLVSSAMYMWRYGLPDFTAWGAPK